MVFGLSDSKRGKLIHIRLPHEVHKQLKMHAAEFNTTVQSWVSRLIKTTLEEKRKKVKNHKPRFAKRPRKPLEGEKPKEAPKEPDKAKGEDGPKAIPVPRLIKPIGGEKK